MALFISSAVTFTFRNTPWSDANQDAAIHPPLPPPLIGLPPDQPAPPHQWLPPNVPLLLLPALLGWSALKGDDFLSSCFVLSGRVYVCVHTMQCRNSIYDKTHFRRLQI